jgi:C1A family cysteine protease
MPDPQFKLGAKKDPEDKRDYKITRMVPAAAALLPPSIDYTDEMSPVGNQYNEGTCVGFACVDGMKEYQDEKEYKERKDLSVRYVYQHCKEIDGDPNEEGTYIRSAMQVLLDNGVCYESCWPYIPNVPGTPCKDADKEAEAFKIERYSRIETTQAMKESLVVNGPFVMSIRCFKGIYSAPGGVVPMPAEGEKPIGGHAVCAVGYDEANQMIKFKNSWGILWGDKGYGYLSYDYVNKYIMDAWSAKDLLYKPPTPPEPSWWQKFVNWFKKLFGWKSKPVTHTYTSQASGNWSDAGTWSGGDNGWPQA